MESPQNKEKSPNKRNWRDLFQEVVEEGKKLAIEEVQSTKEDLVARNHLTKENILLYVILGMSVFITLLIASLTLVALLETVLNLVLALVVVLGIWALTSVCLYKYVSKQNI